MLSEHRLHPASMLFLFGRSLKLFALPGLLFLVAGRSSVGPPIPFGRWVPGDSQPGGEWQVWMMVLLIPAAFVAVARYLSFRVRYEGTELVIRSGIIFRNERHVPYHRIQNLEAVQNVFHRALGVVEVRVETGAGKEPEATISVLPAAAFTEMRRRVFEGRTRVGEQADPAAAFDGPAPRAAEARTLVHLPLRELLLHGFLENRGLILIGAAYGLLWEIGLLNGLYNRFFDEQSYAPGGVRLTLRTIRDGGSLPLGQIAIVLAGIAGLLVVVRLVSMAWATVRLHDFRLTRTGEDLRTEFGLLTRVAATIPLRRIQTLTIREGPLQRLVTRVSVRIETAGGGKLEPGARMNEREWLAPIIHPSAVPSLVREVLPEFDLAAVSWQPVHPRAFRRAVKPALFGTLAVMLPLAGLFNWWALVVLPVAIAWAILVARQRVRHLGWAATDDVVAFRSGWLWRSVTVARVVKIQAVTRLESPFDRRSAMARVRVDTAGASERSHRVDIPYLARDTADGLCSRLAVQAASTEFRW